MVGVCCDARIVCHSNDACLYLGTVAYVVNDYMIGLFANAH